MIYGILFGVFAAFGTGGYFYYTSTEAEIEQLQLENQTYKIADQQQKQTIERLEDSLVIQTSELNRLTIVNGEIQAEMQRYLSIFRRHNLAKLADAKPGLIERRVNDGTQEVFDDIRDDTTIE